MAQGTGVKQSGASKFAGGLIGATVTPLASIFGSGFLVIVGLLASAVGPWSPVAMAAICILAYAIGAVIRHNIAHVEPLLAQGGLPRIAHYAELGSDLALVPAYMISVTLYLRILASFALGQFGTDSEINENILVSLCLVLILGIALWRGLSSLEFTEKWALFATLLVMVLLLLAFGIEDARQWGALKSLLPKADAQSMWHVFAVLGGAVIVVQGFETTRYLGEHYSADIRIRANRLSQIISSIVYILFVSVALLQVHYLSDMQSNDGLLVIVQHAAPLFALPLVGAAVFSQFSAAIADTLGSVGNIRDRTGGKLSSNISYTVILAAALLLTWLADTAQILVLASKAFAAYYGLQCIVAAFVSEKLAVKIACGCLAGIMFAITAFAIPAG